MIKGVLHSDKLEETLKKARLNYASGAFLKLSILAASFVAVVFTVFGFILWLRRNFPLYLLFFLFVLVFFIVFQLVKSIPYFSIQNKKASLESDLLYSARHLLLKLESGSSLVNSIESVSKLNTNSRIYFKEIIYDISLGMPMEDAIEKSVSVSPSAGYSKLLEEILTSLKTGADLNKTLRGTIDDITKLHLIKIQEYGKKLNPMSMFYMIFGTILPSLGTAMLVVVSSFLPGMIIIDKRILLGLSVVVLFAQVFFILAFKSLKPMVVE
jgi:Flp pilus assembly protein TadB